MAGRLPLNFLPLGKQSCHTSLSKYPAVSRFSLLKLVHITINLDLLQSLVKAEELPNVALCALVQTAPRIS